MGLGDLFTSIRVLVSDDAPQSANTCPPPMPDGYQQKLCPLRRWKELIPGELLENFCAEFAGSIVPVLEKIANLVAKETQTCRPSS